MCYSYLDRGFHGGGLGGSNIPMVLLFFEVDSIGNLPLDYGIHMVALFLGRDIFKFGLAGQHNFHGFLS